MQIQKSRLSMFCGIDRFIPYANFPTTTHTQITHCLTSMQNKLQTGSFHRFSEIHFEVFLLLFVYFFGRFAKLNELLVGPFCNEFINIYRCHRMCLIQMETKKCEDSQTGSGVIMSIFRINGCLLLIAACGRRAPELPP